MNDSSSLQTGRMPSSIAEFKPFTFLKSIVVKDSSSNHKENEIENTKIIPYLNEDVLVNIFVNLNVKELFMKVSLTCKSWKKIVDGGRIYRLKEWNDKEIESNYLKFRCQGRECFDNDDWETSIKHFTRALLLNPKDHLSYFWRAYSHAESEKYTEALNDFTKSLELDPQDATTYSNRGATYRDVGDLDNALRDLEMAIKLDPNSASAYNNRGVVFGDLGRLDDAVTEYTRALELDPSHIIAIRNRGRRYQKMDQWDKAHEDFKSLLKVDPKDTEALRFFVSCEMKGIFGYKKPNRLLTEELPL